MRHPVESALAGHFHQDFAEPRGSEMPSTFSQKQCLQFRYTTCHSSVLAAKTCPIPALLTDLVMTMPIDPCFGDPSQASQDLSTMLKEFKYLRMGYFPKAVITSSPEEPLEFLRFLTPIIRDRCVLKLPDSYLELR